MADPAAPSPGSPRTSSSDGPSTVDVSAVLRSPGYVRLLLLAAVLGVPVSAAAYLFLYLMGVIQHWVFTDLPGQLGFAAPPLWWPLPPLLISGVLVALAISRLPGGGGHSPADGFHAGGTPPTQPNCPGSCWPRWPVSGWVLWWDPRTVDRPRCGPWHVRGPPVPP